MSSQQQKQPKPFPAEDAVIVGVCAWLTAKACTFEQRSYVDIVAHAPDGGQQWVIEAKGETANSGLDFRTCLGQILPAMRNDGARYTVAVPATPASPTRCAGISDHVRRALGLHWLLVDRGGQVWLIKPDVLLPDAAFVAEPV